MISYDKITCNRNIFPTIRMSFLSQEEVSGVGKCPSKTKISYHKKKITVTNEFSCTVLNKIIGHINKMSITGTLFL